MSDYVVHPIGFVRSNRQAAVDDDWDGVSAVIELDPRQLDPDATDGLATFSHVEVVFLFDRVDPATVCRGSRHPRGNASWPRVGILAQRAKDRPNRIGATTCRLVAVDGLTLEVGGLDAIDGSPVLDVKPFMRGFAPRGALREPEWARELMAGYW